MRALGGAGVGTSENFSDPIRKPIRSTDPIPIRSNCADPCAAAPPLFLSQNKLQPFQDTNGKYNEHPQFAQIRFI